MEALRIKAAVVRAEAVISVTKAEAEGTKERVENVREFAKKMVTAMEELLEIAEQVMAAEDASGLLGWERAAGGRSEWVFRK